MKERITVGEMTHWRVFLLIPPVYGHKQMGISVLRKVKHFSWAAINEEREVAVEEYEKLSSKRALLASVFTTFSSSFIVLRLRETGKIKKIIRPGIFTLLM